MAMLNWGSVFENRQRSRILFKKMYVSFQWLHLSFALRFCHHYPWWNPQVLSKVGPHGQSSLSQSSCTMVHACWCYILLHIATYSSYLSILYGLDKSTQVTWGENQACCCSARCFSPAGKSDIDILLCQSSRMWICIYIYICMHIFIHMKLQFPS